MDEGFLKTFLASFTVIFLAELGDKTQLAAVGMSARGDSPAAVLAGSCTALVLSSLCAVGVGALLAKVSDPVKLHYAAAALFLVLGGVMLWRGPEVG